MSGPMLIRSITLSEETSTAWKSINGWFPRRERTLSQMLDLYVRNAGPLNQTPIINLGNTGFKPKTSALHERGIDEKLLFNHGNHIRPLVRPGTTRELLGDLLPEYPVADDIYETRFWIKAPGSKGRGKTLVQGHELPQIPKEWDLQVHVEGQEYRVITVDDKVVQVNRRDGTNDARKYEWVGVTNAPSPVKAVAKSAARKLTGRNIIGWDVIHPFPVNAGEELPAYILEGNSCPGVNTATALRIFNMISGRSYDES